MADDFNVVEDPKDRDPISGLLFPPDRGRIIIVNFEKAGTGIPPEMRKRGRPCVAIQHNKLERGRLVTVVPLSTRRPDTVMPYHHLMDHRSFRDMPIRYESGNKEIWAKCDYLTTLSLDRCLDPHSKRPYEARRYVKVRIIAADMKAIEKSALWALGINPADYLA